MNSSTYAKEEGLFLHGIEYISTAHVLKMVQISKRTLQRLRTEKKIGYYKIGSKVLYQKDEIHEWMNRWRAKPGTV